MHTTRRLDSATSSFGTGIAPCRRQHCYFSGRVQGVGFRYTVKNIAIQHNVSGFVRNMPDGRVELVLEGPEGEVNLVIDAVSERMTGYIKAVDRQDEPATGEFEHFKIKHCC